MNKFLFYPLMAVAVFGLLGIGIISVQAESSSISYSPIIQKLVERFNLNPEEVKQVFDEIQEERHQEMENRFEQGLDKAVTDGKITEEQKQTILAKKAEMREKRQELREELKNLSPEERQEKMKELREEMKQGAEENGIDGLKFMGGPGRLHRGFGGFRSKGF